MFYSPHPLLRKRETETATVSYSELLLGRIIERNNPVVCSLDVVATYHLGD